MLNFNQNKRAAEQGSALVYILIAIALLAALTVTFMEPSSQQTTSQNSFRTLSEVESQANVIRSAVQECVLSYPRGDKCINNGSPGWCTTAATTDPAAKKNYPLNPNSAHYVNATPAQSGDRLVRNIRCPGNNGGNNADHDNHELIFTGSSGKFLPPPPELFGDWQYYNETDGVFFWTATSKTDSFITTALTKLDEKFSECEADVIDNSANGTAMDLDSTSAAGATCPANSICFRLWMVTNTASNIYPGDSDGDETTNNPPTQTLCP